MKKKTIKVKKDKIRNLYALAALQRKAGRHKDKKKEQAKKACRERIEQ